MQFLGIQGNAEVIRAKRSNSKNRAIISETPLLGAVCMPCSLNMILPIDRPFEAILERMGKDKLKFYQQYRELYRIRGILEDVELDRLDKSMLQPYAAVRYGEGAYQLQLSDIKRMARITGTLNLVYLNGEEVACHIGSEYNRLGKRYWRGERAGYPKEVFSNTKRLGEINLMNYLLEIEWLIQSGFNYFDIGPSPARPDDRVLQWKRRLRGYLSTLGNYEYFYICPPKNKKWEFFWESPLFGIQKGKPTLHFGKPSVISDEDFIKRIPQMRFSGLSIVYLYFEQPPSDNIMTVLRRLYTLDEHPPIIKFI